jgi:hypothetical protein
MFRISVVVTSVVVVGASLGARSAAASSISVTLGRGVGNPGCLGSSQEQTVGPLVHSQNCSFSFAGILHQGFGEGVADYGLLGALVDLHAFLTHEGHATSEFVTEYTIQGPPGALTTSLNFAVSGTMFTACPDGANCNASVAVATRTNGLLTQGLARIDEDGIVTGHGGYDLTGLVGVTPLGFSLTSPLFNVTVGAPFTVRVTLTAQANASGAGGADGRSVSQFGNTLTFSSTGAVFNLPGGYTANGPNVVDNRFVTGPAAVPAPAPAVLVALGVSAWAGGMRWRRARGLRRR